MDPWVLSVAGFMREFFFPQSPFEYHWDCVNLAKVGIVFADLVSTVSLTYAREIQSSGEYGCGLEGVLRRRTGDVRGILNGIDDRVLGSRDGRASRRALRPRPPRRQQANRRRLAMACGFPLEPDWPIVGIVSRLVEQKGFDLIEQAERELCDLHARFVVLGVGQLRYQNSSAVRVRASVAVALRHRARRGARAPHRGGLRPVPHAVALRAVRTQPALRCCYGTVPVVRSTAASRTPCAKVRPDHARRKRLVFAPFESEDMVMALRARARRARRAAAWKRSRRTA